MLTPHSEFSSRILIVDDQEDNVFFLEQVLKRKGFNQLLSLSDPREVLPLVCAELPDLVLLDLMMPHLDGFTVMAQLRDAVSEAEFLPIIVLTANTDMEARHKALREGANDFLTKPLDAIEVVQRTRNLLQSRALHKAQQRYSEELEFRIFERSRELQEANERLELSNRELENAKLELLARLARAAEYRDDDSGEHTHRIGRLAQAVARQLGSPENFSQLMVHAARLHDLGKIAVADSILLKPGRLTAEEAELMRRHCQVGAELLAGSNSELLELARSIALTHHERWDGSGYPHGLKGEAIPLAGRIVAVVDVYDALTHDRPYKQAWPEAEAVAVLKLERNLHFDPRVVDALLALLDQPSQADPALAAPLN
jgi:putative two-component system response regulator